jgi:hypothetical protein
MIAQIKSAFPHILENSCLTSINKKHTFVFEDNHRNTGIFVSDVEKHHLHLENRSDNYVHFLQNDDCVMKTEKGGQCDYVVFNENQIHFIDVKVAKSNFQNHRKGAYEQIENTFKFYSKKIAFSADYYLHGMVCFPTKRRIIRPSKSTKRKEFKIKYNIDLKEGNYILFE